MTGSARRQAGRALPLGAISQRNPHKFRLGTGRGGGLALNAMGLVASLADLAGVVGGEEGSDDKLAGLDSATASPTSSTIPTYS